MEVQFSEDEDEIMNMKVSEDEIMEIPEDEISDPLFDLNHNHLHIYWRPSSIIIGQGATNFLKQHVKCSWTPCSHHDPIWSACTHRRGNNFA